MSVPEFRFPELEMKAGRLNAPKGESLAPPVSIRDIERDARVIQLNSKLQLYRVGLAGAALGVLFALGGVVAWRWLGPSPVGCRAAHAQVDAVQRAISPVVSSPQRRAPAVSAVPVPPGSVPSWLNADVPAASPPASTPGVGLPGSVFATPVRVVAPASMPLVPDDHGTHVHLPPPVERGPAAPKPDAHKPVDHAQSATEHVKMPVEESLHAKKAAEKAEDKRPPKERAATKDAVTESKSAAQAAILYVAPNRAAPAAAPSRPAQVDPSAARAVAPAQAPAVSPMDIAGVPTEGVILVESSTPDGRLVRPYRVGQTLPSGEVLVSADPSDGRIVTNRRTINLKH